jgi:DNA-binding response OmpR family regulator
LVKLHAGEIQVESHYGKGSLFLVRIPIDERNYTVTGDLADYRQPEIEERESISIQRTKENDEPVIEGAPVLLIVEDNAELRTYLDRHLRGRYEIILSESAEDAIEKASQRVPDIVLSDWMLPGMSGIEFCEKLRSSQMTSHIPVILLTARAGIESRLEGLETGADDYLTKPFEIRELRVRLNNLIRQRNLLREKFAKVGLHQYKHVKVSSADERFIKQFYDFIDKHLADQDLSVSLISQELGVSRVQLHRKLTALAGFSCSELIRDYRLERAADLIRQKSGNISEIAFQVGFENLSYFTRAFKQKFKKTPSAYLQS